ncbi:hypothetical protein AN958_04077 [Leucoagaricus sp. SymC.cos]|nr:hypothetical protein AN958_04077 [Leucoagaricus sp. SymC.cos]
MKWMKGCNAGSLSGAMGIDCDVVKTALQVIDVERRRVLFRFSCLLGQQRNGLTDHESHHANQALEPPAFVASVSASS